MGRNFLSDEFRYLFKEYDKNKTNFHQDFFNSLNSGMKKVKTDINNTIAENMNRIKDDLKNYLKEELTNAIEQKIEITLFIFSSGINL